MAPPRTVAEKMGIVAGARTHVVDAPASALAAMDLPALEIVEARDGMFDLVLLFVKTQARMRETFPVLKRHLGPGGKLWLAWPKARKLGSDLSVPTVIGIGYSFGLVESTNLRVDDTWTALKFTHPKPGKTYHNKYGTLPER